jgi:hypothetical protein
MHKHRNLLVTYTRILNACDNFIISGHSSFSRLPPYD